MKIISMKVDNFKRIKAAEITPDGNIVTITGKNGAGKSSILDAMTAVFCGGRALPGVPIRDGADKGGIKIDLGDHTIIRNFTAKGSYLKVTNLPAGEKAQDFLNKMIGAISFDPLNFANQPVKEQAKIVSDLVGLDFAEWDKAIDAKYDERTLVNRDKKEIEGQLAVLSETEGVPEELVVVSDLVAELTAANEHNEGLKALEKSRDSAIEYIADAEKEQIDFEKGIDEIKAEIKKLEKQMIVINTSIGACKAAAATGSTELVKREKAITDFIPVDIIEINDRIKNAETTNETIRENIKYRETLESFTTKSKDSEKLTAAISDIEQQKKDAVRAAKMPIDGLSISGGIVSMNDIPIDQVSSSEQIKIGVAISMSLNPELRVIRIKDGSLLDSDSMQMIGEMIKSKDGDHEKDYQLWIEVVGDDAEAGILIEDGEIK